MRACVHAKLLQLCPTLCDPWTVTHQSPLCMGFSRQECWSGLPFPSAGDLPDPGIEPRFPALQADALPSEPPGKPPINPHLRWGSRGSGAEREPLTILWFEGMSDRDGDVPTMPHLVPRKKTRGCSFTHYPLCSKYFSMEET